MTLEEFTSLMMGALSGKDPKETLLAVFTVLSRSEGKEGEDRLITLDKLRSVCQEFKVSIEHCYVDIPTRFTAVFSWCQTVSSY